MKTEEQLNQESLDFIEQLRKNDIRTPNNFTKKMGKLIREAREDREWSQAELAQKINRRPATISEIENGKSDISVMTLLVLAIVLGKPISYFFPESLLKNIVMDVKSPFEQEALELLDRIDFFQDQKLTINILKVLADNAEEEYEIGTGDFVEPEE